MDMKVIDTLYASNLEAGDSIRFVVEGEDLGIQEVKSVEEYTDEDGFDFVLVISDNGEETIFEAFSLVDLYGYTEED